MVRPAPAAFATRPLKDASSCPVVRTAAVGLVIALVLVGQPAGASEPIGIWIISGEGAAGEALLASLEARGIPTHPYPLLDMSAVVAGGPTITWLRAQGYALHPNEVFDLHLDQSVPKIKADVVKEALGPVRDGPTILVIDTGLDSQHPDFRLGSNLAANVGIDRSPNGLVSGAFQDRPITDRSGHGSHVAGIVAGSGEAFGDRDAQHGRYQGVYSNGRLASFQAANDAVDPEDIGVDMQAALEAFEWALTNQQRYNIRAISNSWGSAGDIVPEHPVTKATLRAYAAGIAVFFSAGNDGAEGTLNKHCLPPWVLCVGAGTLDKTRSSFSSMGNAGSKALGPYDHPDITAPGSAIRSLTPVLAPEKLGRFVNGDRESLYRDRSGTSMAAPHAAGVAGLLLAANPGLSPDQVMDILVSTADPMSEEIHRVGAGYINAQSAYTLASATQGQLEGFLVGEGVKYAGLATGDDDFSDDPVSIGYDSDSGGALDAALLRGPTPKAWILASVVPGVLLGVGLLLALAGIRWRRPATRYEAPTGHDAGHTGG